MFILQFVKIVDCWRDSKCYSVFYKVGNSIKSKNSTTPPLWGVFMYVTSFAYQKNILVV